jgi:hypothetical protein
MFTIKVMTQVTQAGKHIKKQRETVQIACCPCVPARKFKELFEGIFLLQRYKAGI